jgi:hypothetical protein
MLYDDLLTEDTKIHYFGNYKENVVRCYTIETPMIVSSLSGEVQSKVVELDCDDEYGYVVNADLEICAGNVNFDTVMDDKDVKKESTNIIKIHDENIWVYGEDSTRLSGFNQIYSSEASNIYSYILNAISGDGWVENAENPYEKYTSADEVTNQILNNKRLLINFNLHNKWYTRDGQEEIKYLDTVVMNYLTQMIPSTTILQVQYTSKKD